MKVLVVDDSAVIRTVLVAMMGHLGATCEFASNGHEAIAALARSVYDLVLMDLRMPGLDGPEATRRILATAPAGSRMVVVGMTGTIDAELRARCLQAGMAGVLQKPVRLADLAPLLGGR